MEAVTAVPNQSHFLTFNFFFLILTPNICTSIDSHVYVNMLSNVYFNSYMYIYYLSTYSAVIRYIDKVIPQLYH